MEEFLRIYSDAKLLVTWNQNWNHVPYPAWSCLKLWLVFQSSQGIEFSRKGAVKQLSKSLLHEKAEGIHKAKEMIFRFSTKFKDFYWGQIILMHILVLLFFFEHIKWLIFATYLWGEKFVDLNSVNSHCRWFQDF